MNQPPGGNGGWGPPPGYGPPPDPTQQTQQSAQNQNPYGQNASPYGAPPQANPYNQPAWGAPTPGMPLAGPVGGTRGAITERSSALVVVFLLISCGFYGLYWKYVTSQQLRDATGDTTINPGLDIVLTFVTCGIWALVTDYRNAKKIFELHRSRGSNRSDQSTVSLLCMVFGVYPAAMYILQEEYNAYARLEQGMPM